MQQQYATTARERLVLEREFDEKYFQAFLLGVPEAYKQLYELLAAPLKFFILKTYKGLADDVYDDIVATAWQKCFERRDIFKSFEHIKRWMYVVVNHAAVDELRAKTKKSNEEDDIEYLAAEAEEDIVWREKETHQTIMQALKLIEKLPRMRREVIKMYFIQRKSTNQIANELGKDPQTILNTKSAALATLKEWLIGKVQPSEIKTFGSGTAEPKVQPVKVFEAHTNITPPKKKFYHWIPENDDAPTQLTPSVTKNILRHFSIVQTVPLTTHKRWLEEVKNGDRVYFRLLFEWLNPKFMGLLRNRLYSAPIKLQVSDDQLEDMVAECWLLIFEKREQFKDINHIKYFGYSVLKNNLSEMMKKEQRNGRFMDEFYYYTYTDYFEEPLESKMVRERWEQLVTTAEEGIYNIEGRAGEVMRCLHFRQMQISEVAAQLKVSEKAIYKNRAKALKKLREYMVSRLIAA